MALVDIATEAANGHVQYLCSMLSCTGNGFFPSLCLHHPGHHLPSSLPVHTRDRQVPLETLS